MRESPIGIFLRRCLRPQIAGLDMQEMDLLSQPLVSPPPSRNSMGVRLVVLLVLGLGAGLFSVRWLERRDPSLAHGLVQAPRSFIFCRTAGRIQDVLVKPGQTLVSHQKIIHLDNPELESRLEIKRRELNLLIAETNQLRAQVDVEIGNKKQEIAHEVFETQLKLRDLAQKQVDRQVEQIAWQQQIKRLSKRDVGEAFVSTQALPEALFTEQPSTENRLRALLSEDSAAAALETIAEQVKLCEERLAHLSQSETQFAESIATSRGLQLAEARRVALTEEITLMESEREQLAVVSPGYGLVGRQLRMKGEHVHPGDVLAEVLDIDRPYMVVFITPEQLRCFAPGGTVHIVFPGGDRRRGVIASIDREVTETSVISGEARLSMRIDPLGRSWPNCPIGSPVSVQP